MTLKIVFSSNTARSLYNFRIGLIRHLLDHGMRVIVTTSTRDEFSEKLDELGCEVIDLPMDNRGINPVRDIKTLWDFWRIYRNLRPDIVLHYTIKPVAYGSMAARFLGIPVVNNITGLGTAFMKGGLLRRSVETLYRVSQRGVNRVFFQNRDDRSLFLSRGIVRTGQIEVLPGSGVDIGRFSLMPYPNHDAPVFLLIARLLWAKGVGEYVEAARKVKERYPNVRFQILGPLLVANRTAIPKEEVEGWVREGTVEYLGETKDVVPFLSAADCIVLPSYYREGVPRSLLEAAAIGRPIVTTDAVGCRDVVDNGVNGFLCRIKDSEDLAEQMERLVKMPSEQRRAMGLAGRKKIEQEFDERIVIGQYMDVIGEIMQVQSVKEYL